MNAKIANLLTKIGTPYKMFFKDGNYCGCFYPVYEVFEKLPKYPLPADNPEINFSYGMDKIAQCCEAVEKDYLQVGDIVAAWFRNELHVALYTGSGKIIHVFKDHDLRINRLEALKKIHGYYRVKEEWR